MKQSPIHVLVVDDEELARRNLTLLLDGDPDIGTVTECQSGQEAVEAITKSKPDLVFLDVQMPECGGFDVLELVGNRIPVIIFVTAYDDYALRAFEAGALDYLLKPFDDARFALALSRAKQRLSHAAQSPNGAAERLVIKSRGQVIFLKVTDIDWIEAAGYYACLHVGNETHIIRRTLLELEQDLEDQGFVRIHRSTIVNLERVAGLVLQAEGEYQVVLTSKVQLPLSRRFRKHLQERLGGKSAGD
jgi:two-component system LytT family response regulator